jgi:hypothetical protein
MSDDDALVARRPGGHRPWRWTNLVVDDFYPAVAAPYVVYVVDVA